MQSSLLHLCLPLLAFASTELAIWGQLKKGKFRTPRTSGRSEGSESTLGYPFVGGPGVIAGQIDVFPAERGGMLEQGEIEDLNFMRDRAARSRYETAHYELTLKGCRSQPIDRRRDMVAGDITLPEVAHKVI